MSIEHRNQFTGPEREAGLFVRAARFATEEHAARGFAVGREVLLQQPDCNLSLFGFSIDDDWILPVLGMSTPSEIRVEIDRILATGMQVALTADVVAVLLDRRESQRIGNPWIERDYRRWSATSSMDIVVKQLGNDECSELP